MKAYSILISHLEDTHDMTGWGDYDYYPDRITSQFGLYHSAMKAYEGIDVYMESLKLKEYEPIFIGIKEVDVYPPKFNDEEITEEQRQRDKKESMLKVQERLAYKNRVMPVGKYRGQRICDVMNKDEKYLRWAIDAGIIELNEYERYTYTHYGNEPINIPKYNQ